MILKRKSANTRSIWTLCHSIHSWLSPSLLQPVASAINILAGALYKVFSVSSDQARNELREACFDYLSLGGVFSNGPVSLLSGLNPHPLSLVTHFLAVAVYGVGRLLLSLPSLKRLWLGARLISVSTFIRFLKILYSHHSSLELSIEAHSSIFQL